MIHIVFDLDGTLADTQKIHQQIESDFLASKWVSIQPDIIGKTYAGRSPVEWIAECFTENHVDYEQHEIDAFVHSKDARVVELLHNGKIELMPWVLETLSKLKNTWVKMWISSGACRAFIDDFIEYFHLDMIEASTSADEVIHKKPAPDVFLSTFQKLEQLYGKPEKKWVIGDGKTDVIGGNAAWAQTILCYNTFDVPYLYRIDFFEEILTYII